MAKTKGPLLSLDAHGSLGRVLTYSHRKSGRQVRKYTKPLVAASPKQRGQRRLTEFLVAQWQNMSAGDKATWEANARLSGPNITGYHYFLREAQRDLYTHTGLCGYWHCNEIVGGQVLDLSGNANHGTLEPGYPANAPVLVDSYKTKFSKGLLYDGVDEYVAIGNPPSLQITGAIEIICTIRLSAHHNWQRLFSKNAGAPNKGYTLLMNNAQGLFFTISPDGTLEKGSGFAPLNLHTYYYVNAVYDRTSVEIYINNVKIPDGGAYAGTIHNSTENAKIGKPWYDGEYWHGIADEISVYNRAFSVGERTTRYNFAMREVD